MRIRLLSVALLLFPALTAGVSPAQLPTQTPDTTDTAYVACRMADSVHSVLYLSNIFLGDPARDLEYRRNFENRLRERYPRSTGKVGCSFDPDRMSAEQRQRKYLSLFANLYRSMVNTGWTG